MARVAAWMPPPAELLGSPRYVRDHAPRPLFVRVVVVPPLVRGSLRIALGRVLPFLLSAERGDVEVAPGAAHVLVTAGVDEVGAEDLVALADEGICPVPVADAEVPVEV